MPRFILDIEELEEIGTEEEKNNLLPACLAIPIIILGIFWGLHILKILNFFPWAYPLTWSILLILSIIGATKDFLRTECITTIVILGIPGIWFGISKIF